MRRHFGWTKHNSWILRTISFSSCPHVALGQGQLHVQHNSKLSSNRKCAWILTICPQNTKTIESSKEEEIKVNSAHCGPTRSRTQARTEEPAQNKSTRNNFALKSFWFEFVVFHVVARLRLAECVVFLISLLRLTFWFYASSASESCLVVITRRGNQFFRARECIIHFMGQLNDCQNMFLMESKRMKTNWRVYFQAYVPIQV